ncbi:mechanosensitive ion channel domain-containing protein [Roseimaritima ulvae]|uniref:mechanosensitive ion channel domain-containing protein n=1 Tax=Roseimaritima ulvae TaxID=980254 RepID=UPI00138FF19A|nr:mechanosensitive ion channel domain-containing protein [Roseimaritima ulvae]
MTSCLLLAVVLPFLLGGGVFAPRLQAQQQLPLDPPIDPATPAPVQPIQPTALPKVEDVQKLIETTKQDTEIEEAQQTLLVERYEHTLQSLNTLAEAKRQTEQWLAETKSASKRLASVRLQLERPIDLDLDVNQWSPLDEVKAEKARLEAKLSQLQTDLTGLAAEAQSRKADTKAIPEQIVALQSKIQSLTTEPAPDEELSPAVQQAIQLKREAAIAAARGELETAKQKLARNEAEADLLPAQQQLLSKQIAAIEAVLPNLAQWIARQRGNQIQTTVSQYGRLFAAASPAYQADAIDSPQLMQDWESIVDDAASTNAASLQLRSEWTALQQDYEKIEGLVNTDLSNGGGLSRSVGYLLQRKQNKLPSISALYHRRVELSDAVDEAQATSTQIEARLEDLDNGMGLNDQDRAALESERAILLKMSNDVDTYVSHLVTMSVDIDQYIKDIQKYKQLISKHLLWVRSAAPYRLADIHSLDDAVRWLINRDNLRSLGQVLISLPAQFPFRSIGWAALICVLIYMRLGLKRRLVQQGKAASHRLASAMRPTFQAILWTLLLAAPLPLLMAGPGWLLYSEWSSSDYLQSVGFALMVTAFVLLPLEILRQVVRQGGLATDHFQWPAATVRPIRVALWWMIHTVTPCIFFWRLLEGAEDVKVDLLSLSRILFSVAMVIVAIIGWYLTNPRKGAAAGYLKQHKAGWISQLWWLWRPLLVLLPIALALLGLAGYNYSATQLVFRLYRTIWIVTVATILGGISLRWLLISRRRIAIQQMKQRAADRAAAAEQGTGAETIDSDDVNVSDISAQTQRLIRAVLFVFVLLGLYSAWGPVLPALGFLDSVELWPIKADDGTVIEQVTLSNLLLAIPIIVLTVIVVRNAPGLLETVILQRLPLENAVRYAITTLSSYLFATIGIVAAARVLGIHWSSVQWLVAGLGVGLGFGLQEIFANFISGIILLFEQPIRVGDLVTLDGQTGNVAKIRMRATTITNWDRQEMIVPNKNLITGTLVNWSLTDTTNRIIVKVGVAYGSDTEKTCRVLQEIVDQHSVAVPGLQPVVTFEAFGDSTLNFSVRCYVPTVDVRLKTIHSLHMEIDRRFREENIEIAFPQQDLHIRNVPPQWQNPPLSEPASAPPVPADGKPAP